MPDDVTSAPAFAGVRVLDFSNHFAAAMAAMHLGDLGAEVIKVDPTAEERGHREPGYLAWNRNKKRLALDLGRPSDLHAAKDLVADADVAIFDAAPGVLEPLGLDGASLTSAHDQLVHAWVPPYGERGRWSTLPASHHLLAAVTGIAFGQPSYSGTPVHLVSPQAYYGQANCAATAIGAALFERVRSGRGQCVTVTGLHGAAQVMPSTRFDQPSGSLWGAPLGGAPNYRLYQCADGAWLFLGALFEPIYLRALEVTGVLAEVLLDPEIDGDLRAALAGPGARLTMGKLEQTFRTKTRAEWLALLASADVPSGPVRTRDDWFRGETIAANNMRVELSHAELGIVEMPAVSVRMSVTPPVAPRLAEGLADPGDVPRRLLRVHDGSVEDEPPRAGGPLAGVRVLDLGMVIAGAYAGAILAGLGADVVKIETASGDPFRAYGTGFVVYNRGKRSLVLDLKRDDAKKLFFELVAQSDVVLDNSRLGVRERLGITYERLREVNPRIVSLSISGYGTSGPQASQPGFDPLLQAQSGLMQAQGGEGSEPVFHRIAVNDVGSAAVSACAIVAALFARTRTGEGQELHTSLASQSVLLQIGELTSHAGAAPPPTGARDCLGVRALERYYECTDGWIAIACMTTAHCTALFAALDLPEQDPDVALAAAPDGALASTIADSLRESARDETLAKLGAAGAPAVPVLTIDDTYIDAFLDENDFYESYVDPAFGTARGVAMYARFGRTNSGFERAAPAVGQHTDEVLHDFGLPAARIDALVESGASWRRPPSG